MSLQPNCHLEAFQNETFYQSCMGVADLCMHSCCHITQGTLVLCQLLQKCLYRGQYSNPISAIRPITDARQFLTCNILPVQRIGPGNAGQQKGYFAF